MKQAGIRLDKSVEPGVYYIGFNMDDPVVGSAGGDRSRLLRQAMSMVVDVNEYLRLFTNGRGVPAQTPIPPGLYGYEEGYENPFRKVDLARAKQLLKQAGYERGIDAKTGKPLTLTFDVSDTSPEGRLRFQFFVNQWRRLGVAVDIDATNYNKFQEKVRDGAYQIFMWGWIADYPDPENFLFLLTSEMARSKGGPNTANFSNAKYDELFARMKTRDNDAERLMLIRELRDILETERAWIELFHPESYALFHGWTANVKPPGLSIPVTKYYDLEPGERKERREQWNEPVLWPAYLLIVLFLLVVAPGVVTFLKERQ
jgi:ABC-type transport system substrate-binding protein